ncbi:hypothetical protein EVAR_5696_1 [Eumeta japonica]|uniref:Uncharacterized protein n=1 Tax=Eumeta variegata TaxID=151549 RepID=A0A4C1T887_EUMVA|nr:hypothetical protein EVAR_5696_1 [Eumeta japonica]
MSNAPSRITLDKHLHFRDHIQRVRKLAIFYMSRLNGVIECFFNIAVNHPNLLIYAAASYETPPASHVIRSPRSVFLDPPDDLTDESIFSGLILGALSTHRCHLEVPTRVEASRDSLRRGDPSGSLIEESRADGICMSIVCVR